MMKPVLQIDGSDADPCDGRPVIDPAKAVRNGAMLAAAVIFGWLTGPLT